MRDLTNELHQSVGRFRVLRALLLSIGKRRGGRGGQSLGGSPRQEAGGRYYATTARHRRLAVKEKGEVTIAVLPPFFGSFSLLFKRGGG